MKFWNVADPDQAGEQPGPGTSALSTFKDSHVKPV